MDALGNPLRILLTGGQRHDVTQAEALLSGCVGDHVIADRGYDTNDVLAFVIDHEAVPVIPSRKRRVEQRAYDAHLYKERHLVECFINKIKHYRRVFSRYDKLASRYLAFVKFAATLIWLR